MGRNEQPSKRKIIIQLVVMALMVIYTLCCGSCIPPEKMQDRQDRKQAKRDQRDFRGEGRHKWKGGPFEQNKMFVGY